MSKPTRYHVSKKTQRPNVCTASGACPLGGDTPHFATKDEARTYLALEAAKEFDSTPQAHKKMPTTDDDYYGARVRSLQTQENVASWKEIADIEKEIEQMSIKKERAANDASYYKAALDAIANYNLSENDKVTEMFSAARALNRTPLGPLNMTVFRDEDKLTQLEENVSDASATAEENRMLLESEIFARRSHARSMSGNLRRITGFEENPKYGIPATESTSQGYEIDLYSTAPTKVVSILSYGQTSPQHKGRDIAEMPCSYCGTTDKSKLNARMVEGRTMMACSRCGGEKHLR